MRLDKRSLLIILAMVMAFFGLLGLNQLRLNASLRVVERDPGKTLPTSQKTIRLTFNRTLQKTAISKKNISFDENKKYAFSVSGKKLIIVLTDEQKADTTVVLRLTDIQSIDGKHANAVLKFEVAYVPYDKLSPAEQKAQTQSSDSFETNFPLINDLPYMTPDFNITYVYPDSDQKRMPIIVTSTAINTDDPLAEPDSPSNLALLRQTRGEAMQWLSEHGFNTDKYRLYFGENLLLDEFGGEYDESLITNQ